MTDDFDPRDAATARLLAETPVSNDPQDLERALAAYRGSRAYRGRRLSRHALRLGTVGAVTVLTGSLAAGYAAALPDPVQRVAHHLLSRVGVPGPSHHARPEPAGLARPSPSATASTEQRRRARAHDVRATAIGVARHHPVTVAPRLVTSWSRMPDGRLQLRVHVTQASEGEAVTVVDSPRHGQPTTLRCALNRHGDAVFTFARTPSGDDVLVIRVPSTSRHAAIHIAVRVPANR